MGDMELQVFADRLKELRISLELTQAQFVDDLGITASALSAYEKNLKNPSISVAKRIAEKYHVSIDWLCGLSEKKYNTKPVTYADAIELLADTWDALKFRVIGDNPHYIVFYDDVMEYFLNDWSKMLDLYHEGTIDKKLYKLWLTEKKREYNITIGCEDEIEPFLSLMEQIK